MTSTCASERGYEHPIVCGRRATHRGTDEDGNAWDLCARCARAWADLDAGPLKIRELRPDERASLEEATPM